MNRRIPKAIGAALTAVAVIAATAGAAEDPAARGAKLLEKRRYGEAAAVLRSRLLSPDPDKTGRTVLSLGIAYLKNAQLHRTLQRTSGAVVVDYLGKLAAERGRNRSRLAEWHLGEALLAAGRPREARIRLERFLAGAAKGAPASAVASIDLGLCLHRAGDAERAKARFAGLDLSDPAVGSELAAAYARTGRTGADVLKLADEALSAVKAAAPRTAGRSLKNIAYVYARSGRPDKAVELVETAELSASSSVESPGKNTVLRFYDPFLLDDLATIYHSAAVSWLEKAAADPKVRDAAVYYLGEAYAAAGTVHASTAKADEAQAAAARLPPPYGGRAVARRASVRYAAGRKEEARRDWETLSRASGADPETLAEILLSCDRAGAACRSVADRSETLAEAGESRRMRSLRSALGRYYLGRKEYGKAVAHLEAGRDKGFKNKIESNDPLLLAALAEAYYRVRKFSEAQEIYFEMGKSFPAVRQIQEALQGIYAREQKSPGDVRISHYLRTGRIVS
jgi:tetratricopeptide (TPR) repeat protein